MSGTFAASRKHPTATEVTNLICLRTHCSRASRLAAALAALRCLVASTMMSSTCRMAKSALAQTGLDGLMLRADLLLTR